MIRRLSADVVAYQSRPWAVMKGTLRGLAMMARQDPGATTSDEPRPVARMAALRDRERGRQAGPRVEVLDLQGVITPQPSFFSLLFGGGGGLTDFAAEFQRAVQDDNVSAIVMNVDSPGGLVDLVPETARMIREARGVKPIVSVASTRAASAAYWLAAQADEFVVSPSGDVGSIGVYMTHEDWSGFNEKQGIAVSYVSAGKYKTEGNPDEPLSKDAEKHLQAMVDDTYGMFVADVAAGRGVSEAEVRDGYGEGRVLTASAALEAGMVDGIETLDSVIGRLATNGAQVERQEEPPPPDDGEELDEAAATVQSIERRGDIVTAHNANGTIIFAAPVASEPQPPARREDPELVARLAMLELVPRHISH